MELRPTLLVIVFSILLPFALSEIETTNIISDASSSILFEEFGFSTNGVASVSLNCLLGSQTPNFSLSSLGFYLLSDFSDFSISNESDHSDNFCPLSSNFSLLVLTFEDLRNSAANNTVLISNPDKYNLFFANCLSNSVEVKMDVYTEMYNVDSYGRRQYLPVGRKWLPLVYIVFFVTYCVFLGFWGFLSQAEDDCRENPYGDGSIALVQGTEDGMCSRGPVARAEHGDASWLGCCFLCLRVLQRRAVFHCHCSDWNRMVFVETVPFIRVNCG